jgi:SAM-dependent methyltransferase
MSEALLRKVFPGDLHHVEGLHRAIASTIPERGRVLDLGCGTNADLARYRTRTREVWGADFQKHPKLQNPRWFLLLRKDGTIPFPDAYFDTVTTVMVLEHVADPDLFLREVTRVLRPGGRFIGHSISGMHYVTFISRMFGILPHCLSQAIIEKLYNRSEQDTFPAYYRMNSERSLRRNCEAVGLKLVEFQRYADPGYFRFSRSLETLAILADRLLDGLRSGLGRLYFTVIVEKPAEVGAKSRTHRRHGVANVPLNRITESVH